MSENPELKKTEIGSLYYSTLPENTKLGKLSDFIEIGPDFENYYRIKVGMKYILFSPERPDGTKEDRYYLCTISEFTSSDYLDPFIERKRLFIFT